MTTSQQALRRRQLDELLRHFQPLRKTQPPRKGWINAIRNALGMTSSQLAKRIGITQPSVTAMEQGEVRGSISLNTLRKAADALDCELVYALVPRESLQATLERRVRDVVHNRVKRTAHTMALEDQAVRDSHLQAQIDEIVHEAMKKLPAKLWG